MSMKYGIVLEGGAMRGIFTAGVTDVLMENGIDFDGGAGVSAGACFGCNYKSRQSGRAIRYNLRFCRDKRYCSWRSLIKTGDMFGAKFCYDKIPNELDIFDGKTYKENHMEFYVVCTDIETGKPVYHRSRSASREELRWIRASASMPLASRIVEIDGRKFLDGGISDSIPLRFMEKNGFEKNVVILTQPRNYRKKASRSAALIKAIYGKYPELVRAYEQRPKMYNRELEYIRRSENEGRAFVIAPPEKLPVGHVEHDSEVILEVYRMGRKCAKEALEDVKIFLDMKETENV